MLLLQRVQLAHQLVELAVRDLGRVEHVVAVVVVIDLRPQLFDAAFRLRELGLRLVVHALVCTTPDADVGQAEIAWGAGELCSPRTIAGGFGNPPRVPDSDNPTLSLAGWPPRSASARARRVVAATQQQLQLASQPVLPTRSAARNPRCRGSSPS